MLEKLKLDFKISGTKLTIPFESICTLTNKKFSGDIISEYTPQEYAIEYLSMEKFISQITKNKLTAEELANLVFSEIKKEISPAHLKVTVDVKKSEAHQPVQVWIEE